MQVLRVSHEMDQHGDIAGGGFDGNNNILAISIAGNNVGDVVIVKVVGTLVI